MLVTLSFQGKPEAGRNCDRLIGIQLVKIIGQRPANGRSFSLLSDLVCQLFQRFTRHAIIRMNTSKIHY